MPNEQFADLDDRLTNATATDLAAVVMDGLVLAWPTPETPPAFKFEVTLSMDRALDLIVQSLPNWAITLEGAEHASGGHWSCVLRESGLRDDGELLGIGRATTAPLAMTVALLRVFLIRAKGYN